VRYTAAVEAQFRHRYTIRRRGGRIQFYVAQNPNTVLAAAEGFIGLRLVRDDLGFAREFGRNQTSDWRYVADISRVKVINPLNVLYLRRIRTAENLGEYVVVAPNPLVRLTMKMLSGLVGARVVANLSEIMPPGDRD
jgi:hypothetical protein